MLHGTAEVEDVIATYVPKPARSESLKWIE